ncbi:glutamyl-tRNA reductase [Aquimarina sp. AD10]|uniref:Glutamyl-tRNA reductase n=1 Tax=Aquimarina aggregata TaxID=1642818 RepID=A0A165SC31_9FLAO|nr:MULTISPECIES: glutamyl-tRNA reductase [Aquimarina]AXT61676.1 glutamyl-tRNA reductase [Aquimarina sp. AD10]KZS38028.1 glutamyl-tRNA reductase [Aquimarina aggregata]RKN00975.1 glutamyl-tRNA reductase [Aquimarina sp. AD10]
MEPHLRANGKHFYAIGLSYKKADAEVRGHFSINEEAKLNILSQAKHEGVSSLVVISTCNRTELYGFAEHPFQLIKLLCEHTHGTVEEFEKVAYVHKNNAAISHLFKVGTGLDSQILGDFEIISQIKTGFKQSKKKDMMNPFMERLVNAVIQASKRIKNETEISSGATSVSFAAVQYILARVPYVSDKNLLLFGTGKIGRNTCENLIKHTKNDHIVLINRTKNKAEKIAGKFNLVVKDYANIQSEIKESDVLIVATGAQKPTISKQLIHSDKPLLILDLSIPRNVALDVKELPNVTLVHLDDLSKMTDRTLKRRREHIPQAEAIIDEIKAEFDAWLETRKFAPTIKALKHKLTTLKDAEINLQRKKYSDFDEEHADIISSRIIQKITNHFASHLREESTSADVSIELIQKVFQLQNK